MCAAAFKTAAMFPPKRRNESWWLPLDQQI